MYVYRHTCFLALSPGWAQSGDTPVAMTTPTTQYHFLTRLLEEVMNSRATGEQTQGESGALYSARKPGGAQNLNSNGRYGA